MLGKMNMMPEDRVRTQCVCPPIPLRHFDWCAWVDGEEEGPVGWGPTEDIALEDLADKMEEAQDNA